MTSDWTLLRRQPTISIGFPPPPVTTGAKIPHNICLTIRHIVIMFVTLLDQSAMCSLLTSPPLNNLFPFVAAC